MASFVIMSRVLWVVLVFALTLVPFKANGAEPIKIGAVLSLTGYASGIGQEGKQGLEFLAERLNAGGGINGRPIQLVIYDDAGQEAKAVLATKRLVEEDKVVALIGPVLTNSARAVVPIVNKAKIPQVFTGSGSEIIEPVDKRRYSFRTGHGGNLAVSRALEYLEANKLTDIAVLFVANSFGEDGRSHIQRLAPEYGLKVVAVESIGPADVDATAQLTKIRASGAKALILWVVGGPAVITYKNIKQMGLNLTIIGNHGLANSAFRKAVGDNILNTQIVTPKIFVAKDLPESDPLKRGMVGFAEEYTKKYQQGPGTFAADHYDALAMLAEAIGKVGPDSARIRDYLETNIRGFKGMTGLFTYGPTDHGGLTADSLAITTAVPEGWKLVD